jgi:hypothetical protein
LPCPARVELCATTTCVTIDKSIQPFFAHIVTAATLSLPERHSGRRNPRASTWLPDALLFWPSARVPFSRHVPLSLYRPATCSRRRSQSIPKLESDLCAETCVFLRSRTARDQIAPGNENSRENRGCGSRPREMCADSVGRQEPINTDSGSIAGTRDSMLSKGSANQRKTGARRSKRCRIARLSLLAHVQRVLLVALEKHSDVPDAQNCNDVANSYKTGND